MMTLPNDITRCSGVLELDEKGKIHWREGCSTCARRLCAPSNPERAVMMAPPKTIAFFCEYHIEWSEK